MSDRTAYQIAADVVERHGDRMRYVQDEGRWWIYDDEAGRWSRENLKGTWIFVRSVEDSASTSKIRDVLTEMQAPLAARPQDFDRHPWLLCAANGVVDLRTGELLDHDPHLLMSQGTEVEYHPTERSDLWERHVLRMTHDDEEVASFLRRAVGLTLVGEVTWHGFFVLLGRGRNGKGVFLRTLQRALGDYAVELSRNVLAARDEAHTTSLTPLWGARLAVADEASNWRINNALLKQITGGDSITARRMRQDDVTWRPTHTLWVTANEAPDFSGEDSAGLWDRYHPVDLGEGIPREQRDDTVEPRLRAELSAVLAWAVRGCLEWQRGGLQVPLSVEAAREHHQADDTYDPFDDFLAERVRRSRDGKVLLTDLFSVYADWARERGMTIRTDSRWGPRDLASKLKKKNIGLNTRNPRSVLGVELVPAKERYERIGGRS